MSVPIYDPSYNALNQEQQGGAAWVVAGNMNIDEPNGGEFFVGGWRHTYENKPVQATFTPTASGSNICLMEIALTDSQGVAITWPTLLTIWLSDAASGAGLTATTASGAVANSGTNGCDFLALVTKKALLSQTDATGLYILSITDTAHTGFYVACQVAGSLFVSAQLVAGNY